MEAKHILLPGNDIQLIKNTTIKKLKLKYNLGTDAEAWVHRYTEVMSARFIKDSSNDLLTLGECRKIISNYWGDTSMLNINSIICTFYNIGCSYKRTNTNSFVDLCSLLSNPNMAHASDNVIKCLVVNKDIKGISINKISSQLGIPYNSLKRIYIALHEGASERGINLIDYINRADAHKVALREIVLLRDYLSEAEIKYILGLEVAMYNRLTYILTQYNDINKAINSI